MKILQIVHAFPPRQRAGTETHVYGLSRELASQNEVHVFYPVHEAGSYDFIHLNREGLRIHELDLPAGSLGKIYRAITFRATYRNRRTEQKFAQLLEIVEPDIIHIHHLLNLSASFIEIAKHRKIPVVLTLHDFWFMCPATFLLKPDDRLCKGPDDNCQNCFQCWNTTEADLISDYLANHNFPRGISRWLLNVICIARNPMHEFVRRREYMKSLLLMVDRIIAPSKFLMDTFIQYGTPTSKIVYLDKGHDLSRCKELEISKGFEDAEERKIIFGFVGGILKEKGFDVLIEAFGKVDPEKADLRIYGDYNPNSRNFKKVRAKIKSPNVRFMGRYEDFRKPYSEMDALIFPSICYENRPLALLEASITSTPVIASNIGSIPELVTDKENGLLFEAGNSEALYEKLMMIIRHPALLRDIRKSSQQIKSLRDQASEIETIYRTVLQSSTEDCHCSSPSD
jgi:glycosyltransferase involved in cell wall biosynthesis